MEPLNLIERQSFLAYFSTVPGYVQPLRQLLCDNWSFTQTHDATTSSMIYAGSL